VALRFFFLLFFLHFMPMLNFKSESIPQLLSLPRFLPGLLVCLSVGLGACTSAPKPSTVDESTRRPANDPARIEQLREQTEGERTHMEDDLQRRHRNAYQTAEDIRAEALRPAVRVQRVGRTTPGAAAANTVYTARFTSGSAQLTISAEDAKALVQAAQLAPAIVVRGRTDAELENPTDSRLARERAEAMRRLLVAGGISVERIRIQYQGAGDFVADNGDDEGRAQNRRVEVELYGVAPGVTALEQSASRPTPNQKSAPASASKVASTRAPGHAQTSLQPKLQSSAAATHE
jgi:outer membrane protein OmpA-like peptidoglycan-associated protein